MTPPTVALTNRSYPFRVYDSRGSGRAIIKIEDTQKLYLENLGLEFFSVEITIMTDLLTLSLKRNKLREIPDSILRFLDLEVLDLSQNELTSLPRMAAFEGLAELYLQNNALTLLPPSIGLLTDLETLRFEANPLQDPPVLVVEQGYAAVLEHLVRQELVTETYRLDMRHVHHAARSLDYIPDPWFDLPVECLLTLDVSHNWISLIPSGISKLEQLTHLDVSHNRLVRLPAALGALTCLTELHAQSNRLLHIADELTALQLLQIFDVRETYVGAPPAQGQLVTARGQVLYILALQAGRDAGRVQLDAMDLSDIPLDLVKWPGEMIRASIRSPVDLGVGLPPDAALIQPLTHLYMDHNCLLELPHDIGHLGQLQSLRMRSCGMVTLCPELGHLPLLTHLDLCDNQIRTFPDGLLLGEGLKVVELSRNLLSRLPHGMGRLSSLDTHFLTSTKLEQVPPPLASG